MNKEVIRIEVEWSNGVLEMATGEQAAAIFQAWQQALVFQAISGIPYKGPKLRPSLKPDSQQEQITHLQEKTQELREEIFKLQQLYKKVQEWYALRNSLNGYCKEQGIPSGGDSRWGEELSRRCEPLREFVHDMEEQKS